MLVFETVSDTENPTFHLDLGDLLPSPPSLRIFVYARNAKGKSEKLVLDDITLNDAEKRTGASALGRCRRTRISRVFFNRWQLQHESGSSGGPPHRLFADAGNCRVGNRGDCGATKATLRWSQPLSPPHRPGCLQTCFQVSPGLNVRNQYRYLPGKSPELSRYMMFLFNLLQVTIDM